MKIVESKGIPQPFFEPDCTEEEVEIKEILSEVKTNGDQAIRKFTKKYDAQDIRDFKVGREKIQKALEKTEDRVLNAMEKVRKNLESFSHKQLESLQGFNHEISTGIWASQEIIPLKRTGIYVPAGSFPLVSSLFMGAVPAQVAGVEEIAVFSPPTKSGEVNDYILAAAGFLGSPGIVIMLPVRATKKPAPADTVISRTVTLKPRGRPIRVGSSEREA